MAKQNPQRNSKELNNNGDFFSSVLLWSLGFATLISAVLSLLDFVIFALNENQLLYLFSVMAQVAGGIFGLTLTAYVFFIDKFKEFPRKDETLYDATTALQNQYFRSVILVALTCGLVISLCIIGIIALHTYVIVIPFIINESVLLFLIYTVAILAFGTMLLDPEKLDKELKRMKKEAEEYYHSASTAGSGDFTEFLKTYNLLEHLIIDFAKECMKSQNIHRYDYKPQIIQSLNILNWSEIVNGPLLNEINELRMYRNGLVHGVDFIVTQDVCERIHKIYSTLKHAFDVFRSQGNRSEEWSYAIKSVYELNR